jgi:hypothetical protein
MLVYHRLGNALTSGGLKWSIQIHELLRPVPPPRLSLSALSLSRSLSVCIGHSDPPTLAYGTPLPQERDSPPRHSRASSLPLAYCLTSLPSLASRALTPPPHSPLLGERVLLSRTRALSLFLFHFLSLSLSLLLLCLSHSLPPSISLLLGARVRVGASEAAAAAAGRR